MEHLPPYLTITDSPSQVLLSIISELNPDKIAILVDENTKRLCLPKVDVAADTIAINSGEENKTLETCQVIWKALTEKQFTRNSLIINLGGGVIGDMGGFVASTFKRGMKFINVPTTLLAQADASIGGKLGVDFNGLKNHIGVFNEPDKIVVSPVFLDTLPKRELKSGFAELIKHALIYDKAHWEKLSDTSFEEQDWAELLPHSISIKNQVVSEDPLERGKRKILNFGHTLGHALESYFLPTDQRILHGEAVALGMVLESHLSLQQGWIEDKAFEQIRKYLMEVYILPKTIPDLSEILPLLHQDKKNRGTEIRFSLLKGIGNCDYDVQVSEKMIKAAIDSYLASNK